MLPLEHYGARYRSHRLDNAKREQRSPEYLALNPRGQVPLLRQGDWVLSESLAILDYLERCWAGPDTTLFGATPRRIALSWQGVLDCEHNLRPAAQAVVQPIFRSRPDAPELEAAMERLEAELDALVRRPSGPFTAGEKVSVVDYVIYPHLARLRRAIEKAGRAEVGRRLQGTLDARPALKALTTRVEARAGFERTYPPHWKG